MIDLHRIFDRRSRSAPTRAALHVGIVLAMLGAMLLVPVITASAGVTPTADLQVTQTDNPDPVTSGNDVLYEVTVTNNGPDPSSDIMLQDTLDLSVTFVSVDNGDCAFSGDDLRHANTSSSEPTVVQTASPETVDCHFDGLESEDSIVVDIVVQAPSVSEVATITNEADVFSNDEGEYDPPGNDNSSEDTEVDPQTEGGQVTGYIPPEGGNLTTDPGTGATDDDTTVLTEKFGPGPGGTASLQELDQCDIGLDGQPCVGNIGDFNPPDGYDKVVAVLLYDHSAVRGGLSGHRKEWKIVYQKGADTHLLAMCGPNPVPDDIPCWKSIVRVGNFPDRDLRVRVFINSDPKLATRK